MAYTKDKSKGTPFQAVAGLKKSIQTDKGPGQLRSEFYELEPAEVVDIILDDEHSQFENYSDIGTVICRPCFSEYGKPKKVLSKYKPLNMNSTEYPVIGEYVIVATYFGEKFYTQRLNIHGTLNNGMMPGKSFDINKTDNKGDSQSYKNNNSTGISKENTNFVDSLINDYSFLGRMDLAPVEQKLGEIVHSGRFGQSIRFGTSRDATDGEPAEREDAYDSPNVIIKVGHRLDATEDVFNSGVNNLKPIKEDINLDGTSMFLTTNETVPLITATAESDIQYQRLIDNRPEQFDGKQIILNSDRLIFNTKKNQFMCFSKLSQYFCTDEKFIVDSLLGINLNSPAPIIVSTEDKTIINSPEIYLGVTDEENPGQDEPIVLGETLKGIIEELIDAVMKAQYVNGAGPASLNPANISSFVSIKSKLSTILSKQNFTI